MLKNGQEDFIVAEEACVEEGQSGACLVQGSNKQCLLAVSSLELVETVYHSMPGVPTVQQSIPQYIIVTGADPAFQVGLMAPMYGTTP